MRFLLTSFLSVFLLSLSVFGQTEKPQTIIVPTGSLGNISEVRKKMLEKTLESALDDHFAIVPKDLFEEAQEKAFEELDYEECTEEQCIMMIKEILQVENAFQLVLMEEDGDTQISLTWNDLDQKRVEEEYCEGCKTKKLRDSLVGIVKILLKDKNKKLSDVNLKIIRDNFYQFFKYNGHTYALTINHRLSWSEILNLSNTSKGYPIKINDFNENKSISDHYSSITNFRDLVIGLNDLKKEGVWVWHDESLPYFTSWANGEPNNYHSGEDFAVVMLKGRDGRVKGEWNDIVGTNKNDKPGVVVFEWDFEF